MTSHIIQDCAGNPAEVEVSISALGIQVGPFFIFYEDERLCAQLNADVEFWHGDLVDPLTFKVHTHKRLHTDDTFTIRPQEQGP